MARSKHAIDAPFDPTTWFAGIEERLGARMDAIEAQVTERLAQLDLSDTATLRTTLSAVQLDLSNQREDVKAIGSAIRDIATSLHEAAAAGQDDTDQLLAAVEQASAATKPQIESEAALTRAVLERVVIRLEELTETVQGAAGRVPGEAPATPPAEVLDGIADVRAAVGALAANTEKVETELSDSLRVATARVNVMAEELGHLDKRIGDPTRVLDTLGERLEQIRSAVADLETSAAATDHAPSSAVPAGLDGMLADLRKRVDHQRALSDSLATQVSQMNAALVQAAEEPQQLRRDLDRTVKGLEEVLRAGLREIRAEMRGPDAD